ncbi:MAG TPA: hypothetical protein VN366_10585 [Feifaniaceae bacterium]|nr:hypothetical protein [Feifaniaceae bacterium]
MGRIVIEYPVPEERLKWSHPLMRLVMLRALKAQGVLPEPVYMRCLAQLDLLDGYDAQKERMAGEYER